MNMFIRQQKAARSGNLRLISASNPRIIPMPPV